MDTISRQFNGENESQPALRLDDGGGLRVVNARFVGERQFDWDLFAGYNRLRVLTYSASHPSPCFLRARFVPAAPIALVKNIQCSCLERTFETAMMNPGPPRLGPDPF